LRDDTGGDGSTETKRIANRKDQSRSAACLRQVWQTENPRAFDLDQCNVRGARLCRSPWRYSLSIIGRDFDLVGAINDMIVGYRVTIRRNEEARALTIMTPCPPR